jgi:type IV fimbrial biogenesis protein FimT
MAGKPENQSPGFTLMEIIVVIGILAVISAISVPNMIGWISDNKLRGASRNVVSYLQEIKLAAINENARAVIIFDANAESYVSFIDDVPTWSLDSSEKILRQGTMPEGIDVVTSRTFGYASNGISAGGAANLQLQNTKGSTGTITVNLAGNISIDMTYP